MGRRKGSTMDTHKYGKGTSWEHRKLVKNSVISVTIDDLREGLVVVSFSYEDKMYQGVLLQLNRERGIPSGISFPKDYFSGSEPNETEPPQTQAGVENGVENDPTLIAALPQRHTYFQDKDGTTATAVPSTSTSSTDSTGLRSRVGLRRFIKPPARFKNSRMSLRLRNRPVLCAKCRAFCEEKGALKPPEKKKKKEEETDVSKKGLSGGVTTRNRGKSGVESTTTLPETTTTTTSTTTTSIDNESPQDYSYVSFGTQDFIENYWKRPCPVPESDRPKKPDKSTTLGEAMLTFAKSVPKLSKFNPTTSHVNGHENSSGNNSSRTTTSSDGNDKTVKMKKSKNLKNCVNKLTKPSSTSSSSSSSSTSSSGSSSSTLAIESNYTPPKEGSSELNIVEDGVDGLKNPEGSSSLEFSSRLSDMTLDLPDDKKEDMGASSKTWENRIRKKSVVPARFRDEIFVTKKVFGFKRRRRVEDECIEEAESSELNGRDFPCDELDEISKNKAADVDLNKLSRTEASSSDTSRNSTILVAETPVEPTITTTASNSCASSSSSVVSSSSHNNGHDKISEGKTSVPAKAKTPVIKISFGTPGNGVIVEIPRKTQQQNEEPVSEKAARRAMKKAKKEAKRKCSSSKEPTPPPPSDPPPPPPLTPRPPSLKRVAAEPPQRVCINLKRLCENSYVSWDKSESSNNHELSSTEPDHVISSPPHHHPSELFSSTEHDRAVVSPPPPDSEINDYPMNDPLSNDHQEMNINADSLSTYTDESNSFVYRKDDIIWGKLPGSPWWPGKILDILCVDATDVTARVSWFRASTLSRIRFSQLRPFTDHFDARYARSRKRGSYQLAVRDALIEAHQLDQNGAKQLYPNDSFFV